MQEPEIIDGPRLRSLLSMTAAIDALEHAFRTQDLVAAAPPRTWVQTGAGSLLLMPANTARGAGVKVLTLTPENPGRGHPAIQGRYLLFGRDTQSLRAIVDGAELTALRTGAVSGLAARWLARPGASRLLLFGAGVQAAAHLEAMLAVHPVREVMVVSRSREHAEALAARARDLGLDSRVSDAEAVRNADLICTCTTSPTPLFDGGAVAPGTHVTAVGAHTADTRELDSDLVAAARVVVETREAAWAEAGDLLIAESEGRIDRAHVVADLAEVVRGAQVRTSPEDITVLESVGIAFEDTGGRAGADGRDRRGVMRWSRRGDSNP